MTREISVLHEDDALLAVDKPAGSLRATRDRAARASSAPSRTAPWASLTARSGHLGVLLLAKTRERSRRLNAIFERSEA